jgi:FlaA1/EpsC-like NDP-sugar epimerase
MGRIDSGNPDAGLVVLDPLTRERPLKQWLLHPRIAIVAHDLGMVWAAWTLVHWLRYLIWPDSPQLALFTPELAIVMVCQGVVLYFTGLYRGIWRFASLPDLWNITRGTIYGTLSITLALFLFNRLEGVPRSVFVLYPLVLAVLLGGPRLAYRLWKDHRLNFTARPGRMRVLLIGAGSAGEMLARDLRREGDYYPVGFLDDNRKLWGGRLRDLPVFGGVDQLPELIHKQSIEMVIIAIPSANNQQMRRIVEVCEQADVPFRTIPRLQDMMAGRSNFNEIKEVAIEDLLGRDPVSLDWAALGEGLTGRSVMVSGGGGSIGAELCRQIARLAPARLGLIENSEYNLYRIEMELARDFPDLILDAVLGDICDTVLVDRTVERFKPDLIFHAAAYKHVPLLQSQAREAVRNNVVGTRVMASAATRHGVDQFVLISTDKAVNPVSLMGATKRAAEVLCQNWAAQSETRFVTVRFGNVLDSAGSVVPLFREQIRSGGPVTVTHPEVTRFFMTIPEACQLIMQASVTGESGGIYVLDMGEPVRIQYLAEQMIRLAGKEPGQDVEIVYTGLRPGEKLFEELFHEQEPYQPTDHAQIVRARHRSVDWGQLNDQLDNVERQVRVFDEEGLSATLNLLVPEYAIGESGTDPKVVALHSRKA